MTPSRRIARLSLAAMVWALPATVVSPATATAQATPTRLVVRVLAHDAKIIGTGVQGAKVTITDAVTGAVLAEGIQEGSTGNTDAIVRKPRERGATIFDIGTTGKFEATLNLTEPTRIQVRAEGPLGTEQARQIGSKTLLMVPGVDIVGEGLVVELNGFTVEIQSPDTDTVDRSIAVRARVTMLCGCPTSPGGLWDSDHKRILARLVRDGTVVAESDLAYAGEASHYEGSLDAPASGDYELQVIALEPERANTGMARRRVHVR